MSIQFQADLLTGNTLIDDQHRELFRRINLLLEACDQGKGRQEVSSLLQFLKEYVLSHFAAEERLQRTNNFPDYTRHRQQHEDFITKLHDLEAAFAASGPSLALVIETNRTVIDWLRNHILKMDKELARFLRECGAASP